MDTQRITNTSRTVILAGPSLAAPFLRATVLLAACASALGACAADPAPRTSLAAAVVSAPARTFAPVAPAVQNGCAPAWSVPRELPSIALSSANFDSHPVLRQLLCSSDGQAILRTILECALTGQQTIETTLDDGTAVSWSGQAGFASEWADGPCDRACQEWVSACYAAKHNMYGVHVELLFKAPKPGSPYDEPQDPQLNALYPNEEGAFFGNLWEVGGPRMLACRGRGADSFYAVMRACSMPGAMCDFGWEVLGSCDYLNGATGERSARRACDGGDPDTHFTSCHALPDASGRIPGRTWTRPITVHTHATSFGERAGGGC